MSGRLVRWALALAHRPRRRGAASLTIVRHHRVYADHERPLYRLGVSASVLEAQLALLARAGLAPLTVTEGLARLAEGRGRWVAMSFDDGYADNVERALPLLERHGGRATFYLTAGLMESRVAPWWDELTHVLEGARRAWTGAEGGTPVALDPRERAGRQALLRRQLGALRARPEAQRATLDALRAALGVDTPAPCALATWEQAARLRDRGMELGAHTLTHPFLSTLDAAEQTAEIDGSRALIERRLGVRTAGLAYPVGDHDARTLEACRALGFAHAVTTRRGDVTPGAAPFTLLRRGLSDGACLGPGGRFSARLAMAELDGAFDRLRGTAEAAA